VLLSTGSFNKMGKMIELNETGLQFTIIYQTVSFSWFFLVFVVVVYLIFFYYLFQDFIEISRYAISISNTKKKIIKK
jgi:hypothetical protein